MTTKFQVGKTYSTRSICDSECIFSFTILGRTAKTVTVYSPTNRNIVRRRLDIDSDIENFSPFGNYSMAPIIRADDRNYFISIDRVAS